MDRQRLASLLDRGGVRFAYLFGSRATSRFRPDSDLDIAVMFDGEGDHLAERLDLMAEISQALGIETEVAELNGAPLALSGRVATEGSVLVDHDPSARARFESLAFRMYADYRIHAEADSRASLRSIAEGRR